jgi:DNA processing protein
VPLSRAALAPLLRLSLVPGVGPQRLASLLRRYGSAERALSAPARELRVLPGLGPELARRIGESLGPAGDATLRHALDTLRREEAAALTPDDADYPESFRTLAEPPFLLFAAGDLRLLRAPSVAFVGTRSPSRYGREAAAALAEGLAGAGYAIVSGMARGIDTEAHQAALAAGGTTIGVLGHGIDSVYPPENRGLFRRVRREGLLITEFVPGERPKAGNFPRRNRLIAALSRAVVVVEMGLKSGAQHTVSYALELGREVLAVPGPIGAATSAGTNQLIRDGARMVTSVGDILEELEGVGSSRTPRGRPATDQATLPLLAPDEDRVVRLLSAGARHVDALSADTGIRTGALLGLLLDLELRGLVESLPAKHFRRRS